MSLRASLLMSIVPLTLVGGCVLEGRAYNGSAGYYPPQPINNGYDNSYGYTNSYAPNAVYYSGGYYGGTYYRPGYYNPSAPFISVQSAPNAYVAPTYGGAYVQPAQPAYPQQNGYVQPAYPPQNGYVQPAYPPQNGYVQPAQPAYVRPAYAQPAQPAGGYVQPAQPAGGYVQPAQPAAPPAAVVAPRAGVPQ